MLDIMECFKEEILTSSSIGSALTSFLTLVFLAFLGDFCSFCSSSSSAASFASFFLVRLTGDFSVVAVAVPASPGVASSDAASLRSFW